MRIAAFNGSPRDAGNTDLLLHEAVRPAEYAGHEIALFNLNAMNIQPCQDCSGCDNTGECTIDDDMRYIYDAIRTCDRFILASPIFFFALSAQAKIMIDRCQTFWCEKYLLKKPIPGGPFGRTGLLLLVGGMEKDVGIECAGQTAKAWFRTISVNQHETVSFLGIDRKGAVCDHPTAMTDAYEAGRKLIGTGG